MSNHPPSRTNDSWTRNSYRTRYSRRNCTAVWSVPPYRPRYFGSRSTSIQLLCSWNSTCWPAKFPDWFSLGCGRFCTFLLAIRRGFYRPWLPLLLLDRSDIRTRKLASCRRQTLHVMCPFSGWDLMNIISLNVSLLVYLLILLLTIKSDDIFLKLSLKTSFCWFLKPMNHTRGEKVKLHYQPLKNYDGYSNIEKL